MKKLAVLLLGLAACEADSQVTLGPNYCIAGATCDLIKSSPAKDQQIAEAMLEQIERMRVANETFVAAGNQLRGLITQARKSGLEVEYTDCLNRVDTGSDSWSSMGLTGENSEYTIRKICEFAIHRIYRPVDVLKGTP